LPDRSFVASLHVNSLHSATHRRWDFDNSLIGFQFQYRLLFSDALSYGDQDLDHIAGFHALAQLGQYKLERCHGVSLPSTPAWG
jgi:myo-inositol catabolism protein IolC